MTDHTMLAEKLAEHGIKLLAVRLDTKGHWTIETETKKFRGRSLGVAYLRAIGRA